MESAAARCSPTESGASSPLRVQYVAKNLEERSAATSRSATAPSVTAVQDDKGGGILTKAARKLDRGDCVLQCCAAGIAIESQFRASRCAYCAEPCRRASESDTLCRECGVVAACSMCLSKGADKWHSSSSECQALRALVKAFSVVFGLVEEGGDGGASINVADLAKEIDSSYILTVRLLHRRWYDEKERSSIEGDMSIMPAIDWKLFESLHKTNVRSGQYDLAITAICQEMRDEDNSTSRSNDCLVPVITKDAFDDVLERVVGCGHAVVDLTLGLGSQTIGRAIFAEHSFYNHSCCPNAFISCNIGDGAIVGTTAAADSTKSLDSSSCCALVASVHCLSNIDSGDDVCLSYIPTSGLSRNERHKLLHDGYHFECRCRACRLDEEDATAKEWDRCLAVPEGSDLEPIREVQYAANQIFVDSDDKDEIERSIGIVRMVANGINRQGIASSHECAMEVHRLLSVGYAALNRFDDAIGEHRAFFSSVEKIAAGLFDPIALSTQHIEFALVLHKNGDAEGELRELKAAEDLARTALGRGHSFVVAVERKLATLGETSAVKTSAKNVDDFNAGDSTSTKRQKIR